MSEIKHTWFFVQSPEEVWHSLTDPVLMAQWLMKTDFKPEIGHEFQFHTGPIPSLELDGIFNCRVLEIQPFKKLVYSWQGGPGNGIITLDTLLVWMLTPKNNGTELQLTHSGFTDANAGVFSGMLNGWLQNIQKIVNMINKKEDANTNT